jgi:hypothetical protein
MNEIRYDDEYSYKLILLNRASAQNFVCSIHPDTIDLIHEEPPFIIVRQHQTLMAKIHNSLPGNRNYMIPNCEGTFGIFIPDAKKRHQLFMTMQSAMQQLSQYHTMENYVPFPAPEPPTDAIVDKTAASIATLFRNL